MVSGIIVVGGAPRQLADYPLKTGFFYVHTFDC